MKKMLLHTCCAPCATAVIDRLRDDYELTLFFYNPNIHPKQEYVRRRDELKNYSNSLNVPFVEGNYNVESWYEQTKLFNDESGVCSDRCKICYDLRLKTTAACASMIGADWFTTTLSVSPHKDFTLISNLGKHYSQELDVKFLDADFKKKDGFKKSVEMSNSLGMYRQDYCGCEFSRQDRDKRNKERNP